MKILIVDDEVVSRKKLVHAVQGLGHETISATDGKEGWDLWNKERPSLVITDWIMPKMVGPELCARIRDKEGGQYTYLIIVTSKDSSQNIIEGMKAGADDYITKPFNKGELAARIKAGERVLSFQSRELVIFSMAKLAESRDPDTGFHLERISFYSETLAESIMKSKDCPEELDAQFIDNIRVTSPLHDIGKIGVPDHVLLKQGSFDDKEFDIMKTHTVTGFQCIQEALKKYPKADYLNMSAEIALSHHEKYDGSGYPNGIQGEEIPLCARIVALADVYDALVSKRAYKGAYTYEVAESIIHEDKGKQFDPKIVDVFLSILDEFKAIHRRFKQE